MPPFLDFILHIDKHIEMLINQYGFMAHGILFLIIFLETGLVVMPFLPGDTLLFAAGLFAQPGKGFNVYLLLFGLPIAAIIGDTVNFFIGKLIGRLMMKKGWVKEQWVRSAEEFYAKHGKKTIVIGRFVPIVRTVAPFVAGMEIMPYRTYLPYCVFGSFLWVFVCTGAGYLLGKNDWVRHNFEFVILGIAVLSLLLVVKEVIKERKKSKAFKAAQADSLTASEE